MANVCQTCGVQGFVEALVYCDSCKFGAVHRYCCGITPVPVDDYVVWFCSDCDESDSASDSKQVDRHDAVEVSSSSPLVLLTMEELETRGLIGLLGSEVSVSEAGDGEKKKMKKKKKKKKKRKIITHSLLDATIGETVEVSKKQDGLENGKSDELIGLASNEVSVLEKSGKKTDKGGEKKNEESSNHLSQVLEGEGHGLQGTTSVEPMKESKKHKTSDGRVSDEISAQVLAAKEHVAYDDTNNVEPAKAQESSASRKPYESAGLEKNGASVSEGGNSTNVPDHNSCTTSKKRRLSENMELPAKNSSCKKAESNMPQTNKVITSANFNSLALNNDRAQPVCEPIWRGSLSVKQGNICSIDGLVAHLSTLACHKVYEKAGSLHTRLSAKMFPRLDIWPPSFLKNGPPTDESIALYFFPSRDSNGEKVYYSLVHEMKKNDLAMRCFLEDVELLLFTSYQLPMPCWKFHSKEYLWGIFRRIKTSRH